MSLVVTNTTNAAIEIFELGFTVPASDSYDLSWRQPQAIAESSELAGYVANGILLVVNEQGPPDFWPVADALSILKLGVTGAQLGIAKPTRPGTIDGNYYGETTDGTLINDNLPGNHFNAIPVDYIGVQFNRIGICVTNAVANSEVRLGVYENNNGLPGKLLLDAGVVPTDTIGNKEIIIDFVTPNDWCFLSTWSSNAIEVLSTTATLGAFGNLSNNITEATRHFHTDYTYVSNTALPDVFPNTVAASSQYPPYVWFRRV